MYRSPRVRSPTDRTISRVQCDCKLGVTWKRVQITRVRQITQIVPEQSTTLITNSDHVETCSDHTQIVSGQSTMLICKPGSRGNVYRSHTDRTRSEYNVIYTLGSRGNVFRSHTHTDRIRSAYKVIYKLGSRGDVCRSHR